ncbi:MAG: alpha/beta hydrolase [Alphaproteobacteria bacterium]|nr:alpha/beta hydrolase [Alphaproteobacteria bacterium]
MMRWVRFGLAGLVAVYALVLAGMYSLQRDFIFDARDTGGRLFEAGTLAIEGSSRVAIETADGETLAGWYLPPKQKDGNVFLFFHGKGGGLERKKWRWQRIAEHGKGVLAFSYRGFPGSTGSPSEEGLFEDARAAFNWLSARHSKDRIVLHGLSLGTGVAAKLATEVEARALIIEAGYAALVDVAGARHPYFPVSLLLWDQFRTRDFIGRIKCPVMIAHGDKDTVIPFEHAEELYALAPEPKVFVVIPGGDHNTLVRDGIYQHIWKFIEKPDAYKAAGAG